MMPEQVASGMDRNIPSPEQTHISDLCIRHRTRTKEEKHLSCQMSQAVDVASSTVLWAEEEREPLTLEYEGEPSERSRN